MKQREHMQYPEQPEVPVSETPPEQNDPKKVAAGRAGAASRKSKHEQLLNELCESKADMVPPTKPADDKVSTKKRVFPRVTVTNDWVPWIIGSVGLAGVIWLYLNKLNNETSHVFLKTISVFSVPAKHDGFTDDLKINQDPLYMQ